VTCLGDLPEYISVIDCYTECSAWKQVHSPLTSYSADTHTRTCSCRHNECVNHPGGPRHNRYPSYCPIHLYTLNHAD
jgi:hypothetical protein